MRPFVLCLTACALVLGFTRHSYAQKQKPAAPPAEEPAPAEEIIPTTPPEAQPEKITPGAAARNQWQDIVVVPRKAVLKTNRLELAPFAGVTLNDPLIRHFTVGGMATYYFSDVFGVGLEGAYYKREITDRGSLIGLQYHRVPTMNEIHWAGALDFSYAPIYGKFAFFNHGIIHWETMVIGGVGVTNTEVIPRNPSDPTFLNYDITPNLGIGSRFFMNSFWSIWFNFRDYIFPDKFENLNRMGGTGDMAKAQADTQIVNNVVFAIGASFFVPPVFSYHTPR